MMDNSLHIGTEPGRQSICAVNKSGVQIVRPIFIVGPGRSGTTLLLHMMSLHPDVAWFSGWTDRFPRWPQLALLSRLNDLTPLEKATRELRKWPRPSEAYGIWNSCFPSFSRADSDWDEEWIDETGAAKLTRLIKSHLRWHGKKRFLTKYTGWPKLRFLKAVFPDAYFIYIDRDPRAVVFSYMKQKWGFKNKPHLLDPMSMRQRLEFYTKRYLALYQAKRQLDVSDYIQVYYEQLIEDPLTMLREICAKTTLPPSDILERRIDSLSIERGTNQIWRHVLLPEDQAYLAALLKQPLEEMEYEV